MRKGPTSEGFAASGLLSNGQRSFWLPSLPPSVVSCSSNSWAAARGVRQMQSQRYLTLHLDLHTQVLATGSAYGCASCLPQIQPQHRVQVWFSFFWSNMLDSKCIFPTRQKILLPRFQAQYGLLFRAGFFLALVPRSDSAEVAERITHISGFSNPHMASQHASPMVLHSPFATQYRVFAAWKAPLWQGGGTDSQVGVFLLL